MEKDILDILFDVLTENYKDEIEKNKDFEEYLKEKNKKELLFIYLIYEYATNMKDEDIEEKLEYLYKKKKEVVIQEIIKLLDKNFYKILEFFNKERFETTKNIAKKDGFFKFNRNEPSEISFDTLKNIATIRVYFLLKKKRIT